MRYVKESLIFLWLFLCLFLFVAAPKNYSELKGNLSSLFSSLLLRPSLPAQNTLADNTPQESEELDYLRKLTRKQQLELHQLKENLLQIKQFKNTYQSNQNPLVFAEVLHYDVSPNHRSLYLNKGLLDGVRKGIPVLKGEALIGEIVEVGKRKSRVRLLNDPQSQIRIALLPSEILPFSDEASSSILDQGILKGDGEEVWIEWLPMDIKIKGDETILTSMMSSFGKGILIGEIEKSSTANQTLFHEIKVLPFADLENIQNVTLLIVPSPSLNLFDFLQKKSAFATEEDLQLLEECFLADLDEVEPDLRLSPKQMDQLGDWFTQHEKFIRGKQCYRKAIDRNEYASKAHRLSRRSIRNIRGKLKELAGDLLK